MKKCFNLFLALVILISSLIASTGSAKADSGFNIKTWDITSDPTMVGDYITLGVDLAYIGDYELITVSMLVPEQVQPDLEHVHLDRAELRWSTETRLLEFRYKDLNSSTLAYRHPWILMKASKSGQINMTVNATSKDTSTYTTYRRYISEAMTVNAFCAGGKPIISWNHTFSDPPTYTWVTFTSDQERPYAKHIITSGATQMTITGEDSDGWFTDLYTKESIEFYPNLWRISLRRGNSEGYFIGNQNVISTQTFILYPCPSANLVTMTVNNPAPKVGEEIVLTTTTGTETFWQYYRRDFQLEIPDGVIVTGGTEDCTDGNGCMIETYQMGVGLGTSGSWPMTLMAVKPGEYLLRLKWQTEVDGLVLDRDQTSVSFTAAQPLPRVIGILDNQPVVAGNRTCVTGENFMPPAGTLLADTWLMFYLPDGGVNWKSALDIVLGGGEWNDGMICTNVPDMLAYKEVGVVVKVGNVHSGANPYQVTILGKNDDTHHPPVGKPGDRVGNGAHP